jgi:dienelactone hydrolase
LESSLSNAPRKQGSRRRIPKIVVASILFVFLLLLARPAFTHLRAAGLLLRIQDPNQSGLVARISTYPVKESLTDVVAPSGKIHARLYIPMGAANAPGMVIVHGVHHLGIEEPRMVRFARAMAASGIRVLTPELAALADYQIDSHSVALIGYSARRLSFDTGQKVGVLGLSFAGGLSLLAASDPQFEPCIRFVISVGAHDDLERVSGFLITNTIARPDGTTLQMAAHEYGPLVLIYSHAQDFFPPADLPAAHDALQLLLWEKVDESRKQAERLSPASRQKMDLLYKHDVAALNDEMKQALARHQADMSPVSPHGHMDSLHVPVLLLHGAADNVIPPSELLWLQKDVPPEDLVNALVSPALSHVSMEGDPSLSDKFRLVHFMAQMLELEGDTRVVGTKP